MNDNMFNDPYIGTEWWTIDDRGNRCFCSTTSLEHAVKNHLWEMANCDHSLSNTKYYGPIAEIEIIHRQMTETKTKLTKTEKRPF